MKLTEEMKNIITKLLNEKDGEDLVETAITKLRCPENASIDAKNLRVQLSNFVFAIKEQEKRNEVKKEIRSMYKLVAKDSAARNKQTTLVQAPAIVPVTSNSDNNSTANVITAFTSNANIKNSSQHPKKRFLQNFGYGSQFDSPVHSNSSPTKKAKKTEKQFAENKRKTEGDALINALKVRVESQQNEMARIMTKHEQELCDAITEKNKSRTKYEELKAVIKNTSVETAVNLATENTALKQKLKELHSPLKEKSVAGTDEASHTLARQNKELSESIEKLLNALQATQKHLEAEKNKSDDYKKALANTKSEVELLDNELHVLTTNKNDMEIKIGLLQKQTEYYHKIVVSHLRARNPVNNERNLAKDLTQLSKSMHEKNQTGIVIYLFEVLADCDLACKNMLLKIQKFYTNDTVTHNDSKKKLEYIKEKIENFSNELPENVCPRPTPEKLKKLQSILENCINIQLSIGHPALAVAMLNVLITRGIFPSDLLVPALTACNQLINGSDDSFNIIFDRKDLMDIKDKLNNVLYPTQATAVPVTTALPASTNHQPSMVSQVTYIANDNSYARQITQQSGLWWNPVQQQPQIITNQFVIGQNQVNLQSNEVPPLSELLMQLNSK